MDFPLHAHEPVSCHDVLLVVREHCGEGIHFHVRLEGQQPSLPSIAHQGVDPHLRRMIETNWGNPVTFAEGPDGVIRKISTVEQAHWRLTMRWPMASCTEREQAAKIARAAMECVASPQAARAAFIRAAERAGLKLVA